MVGSVESGALEDDTNRGIYLMQRFLVAFRTARQGLVAEGLAPLKLHTTFCTTISIDWHSATSFSQARRVTCGSILALHYSEFTIGWQEPASDSNKSIMNRFYKN